CWAAFSCLSAVAGAGPLIVKSVADGNPDPVIGRFPCSGAHLFLGVWLRHHPHAGIYGFLPGRPSHCAHWRGPLLQQPVQTCPGRQTGRPVGDHTLWGTCGYCRGGNVFEVYPLKFTVAILLIVFTLIELFPYFNCLARMSETGY